MPSAPRAETAEFAELSLAGRSRRQVDRAGAARPVVAAELHDGHHRAAPVKLQLDQGKEWATVAPLRQAMGALRAEFAGKPQAINQGGPGKEDYAKLGQSVEGQVSAIVSQCKLEPKADAMLHIVVGQLLAAADTLQGRDAGLPAEAARRVVMALNSYGKYFVHPGWQAIR